MRICLIGAGNLATQLGFALAEKNHQVVQVWSKTSESAEKLAERLNSSYTTDIDSLVSDAEIYIIAVRDEAIAPLLASYPWGDNLVVHTAGSIPISILDLWCRNFGVFYPFQTFTKEKKVDFKHVPVCIEANNPQNLEILDQLGRSLSENVRHLDSQQREQIHLAAVFACNFVNHFYAIAKELMDAKAIDFDIIKPLILETAQKAVDQNPELSQTGPAIRNDNAVMDKHLSMLANHPDLQIIYKQISQQIIQTHKNKNGIF